MGCLYGIQVNYIKKQHIKKIMNSTKFTIVVPVYKIPYKLLYECLDSVANQSYHDYEVLIIDDESPDECGKICDEYARK